MALDSLIPPNGNKMFSEQSLKAIQEEIVYWNAGTVRICQTRDKTQLPIPVNLYRLEGKKWKNFGTSLIKRGLADFGDVDCSNDDFKLHARLVMS